MTGKPLQIWHHQGYLIHNNKDNHKKALRIVDENLRLLISLDRLGLFLSPQTKHWRFLDMDFI
jgi:hypothetical protein